MNSPITKWRYSSTCSQTLNLMCNMKIIVKTLSVIFAAMLALMLCACDFDESKHHLSGGELLDDEKMSVIKSEILSEEAEKSSDKETSTKKDIEETDNLSFEAESDTGDIVYWTESGAVWHRSASCSHIKSISNLFAGTVTDAKNAGKSNACSRCFD